MMHNKYLQEIISSRPEYVDIFIENSDELAERIYFLMKLRGIDQKRLSQLLGKNESEVSKWLSGTHNFTFKTVAKIESVLKGKLFQVCANNECNSDFESAGVVTLNYKTASFNIFEADCFAIETYEIDDVSEFRKYSTSQNVSLPTEVFTN
ncbi:helix-turn-helix domain-containing protein [Flavobacterium sp.]|uniref:helix-turn-helix domain-containing protein n=1 Tax=Flavobacterium sp. TaxID=239 RepID=UPI003B9B491C